jgi:hypothetical protein
MVVIALVVGAFQGLPAQEVPPLILDERPTMTIRNRPRDERSPSRDVEPVPTPDPSKVIVALVNERILTREELDARIADRFKAYEKELEIGRTRATENFRNVFGNDTESARLEIAQDMKENLENAKRAEEGLAVGDWVEHALLADEARRQGIVVSQSEFQARSEEVRAQAAVTEEHVTAVLTSLRIPEVDFQRSLYDAILIERLVERYISLNWTEEELRRLYGENPSIFFRPKRFYVAHFSISLDGSETNEHINQLEALARRVRNELRGNADAETIFARPEFSRLEMGIWGTTSFFTFQEGHLPRPIEVEARKLRLGETSDVLINRARYGERIRPRSLHVIKILNEEPARGDTFESALPDIQRNLVEIARNELIARLRSSGTHRIIINVGGIPPNILPSPRDIQAASTRSQGINLRFRE